MVPFLTLVGDPSSAAARIPLLAALRDGLGAPNERGFLLAAGFAALAAIAVSTATNAAVTYAQLLFTNLVGFRLSRRLLARYLARDRLFSPAPTAPNSPRTCSPRPTASSSGCSPRPRCW